MSLELVRLLLKVDKAKHVRIDSLCCKSLSHIFVFCYEQGKYFTREYVRFDKTLQELLKPWPVKWNQAIV